MPAGRNPYPAEFREQAVQLVKERGLGINSVARELGICHETLRVWVRQEEQDKLQPGSLTVTEREELERLRREVKSLREDKEILRKAVTFFAQEANRK